jgi:BASS family bile acid:Na+ symporter
LESNIFITVFFPVALAIIMFGMGLSLVVNDFKRIVVYPKAVALGLVGQLVLVPATGFLVASVFHFSTPELAVGLVVVAVCVGGSNSTLLNLLVRGDVPLSITLSAFTNTLSVFTIPFIVNLALVRFLGAGQVIQLPVGQTILQLLLITIAPLAIGMALNACFPQLTGKAQRPVKIASAILLVIVITGALFSTGEIVWQGMKEVGLPVITLDVVLMLMGYGLGLVVGLNQAQRICMGIEFGIQNGVLAVAIASSPLMLNSPMMTLTPIVYSLLMLILGLGFGAVVNLLRRGAPEKGLT